MVKGLHDLGWMVEKPKASMYIWAELPEFYKSMGNVDLQASAGKSQSGGFSRHRLR